MSTNVTNNQSGETSKVDLLLDILQTTNTIGPVATQAVASIISIIKQGKATGKTDEEIKAQAADSRATTGRVRDKAKDQMSDRA